MHRAQHSLALDRKHHHAGRGALACEVVDGEPERVPQNQLLERDPRAEAQRARAQPADGARRDLDDPHALAVEAELRVDGSVLEPDRGRGAAR